MSDRKDMSMHGGESRGVLSYGTAEGTLVNGGAVATASAQCGDEERAMYRAGLVGRTVCKEFDLGALLEGTVAYAHRPDGETLLYRVEYADGDTEDLPEDEAIEILVPLVPLAPATTTLAAEVVTPQPVPMAFSAASYPPPPQRHIPQSCRVPPTPVPAVSAGTKHKRSATTDVSDVEIEAVSSGGANDDVMVLSTDDGPMPSRRIKRKKSGKNLQRSQSGGAGAADGNGTPVAPGNGGSFSLVEDAHGLVGRSLWKQFGNEMYHGVVAFAHVLESSAGTLYRVNYDDGDMEDLHHEETLQLIQNDSRYADEPTVITAPQTPAGKSSSSHKKARSTTGAHAKGMKLVTGKAGGAAEDSGTYVDNNPEAAVSKFDEFMDVLIMAYEARGMERRKSRQFDGTDVDQQQQQQQQGAKGEASVSGASQGLLRREVSRAYKEVASAGKAVSNANVDALAMLLRLLDGQTATSSVFRSFDRLEVDATFGCIVEIVCLCLRPREYLTTGGPYHERVRQGMSIDMYPLAATCSEGDRMGRWGQECPEALATLEAALEACLVCLMIVTCPGLDRRLLSDELIDSCLGLFRHHLARHIAPALDPSMAATFARGEDRSVGATPQKSGGRSKGKTKSSASKAGKKNANSNGEGRVADVGREGSDFVDTSLDERLREVSKKLSRGLGKAYEIMGLLDLLVIRVKLEDRILLQLCSACKCCLLFEASASDRRGDGTSRVQPLQHGALSMLQSVTRRYPGHRTLIVEDAFGLLLKMPTGRRQLRTFRLSHVPEALGGANGGTDGYIQNVTALVMLLVQSCVASPPVVAASISSGNPGIYSSPTTPSGSGGRNRRLSVEQKQQQSSGVNPARSAATYFASRFLSRCAGKEEGTNFQPLLSNVVDDLLASILLPEWPAAELLLLALCRALVKDLKDQKGSGRDQQYTLMAMDVLGKVAGGLADITRRERECPMVMPHATAARDGGQPGDQGENVSCVCGRTPGGDQGAGLMLDCDRCHSWFHGPCVGIASQEECPPKWFCMDCTILRQVSAQKNAYSRRKSMSSAAVDLSGAFLGMAEAVDGDLEVNGVDAERRKEESEADFEVSDLDVFRQLVLNRLTADSGGGRERGQAASSVRSGSASASRSSRGSGGIARRKVEGGWGWQARQTQLALWIEEAAKRQECDGKGGGAAGHLLGQWEPTGLSNNRWDAHPLGHDGILRLCRRLLVERELCSRGLDAILGHLLGLLRDPATSLRARAVKRLGGLVDADASIMSREAVQKSVTSSFLDEAVSVRQAAVDLVGKYILAEKSTSGDAGAEDVATGSGGARGVSGAKLLDTYYPALMNRLLDKGVSVRKNVVRILRGVLLWRSPHPRHTQICQSLVYRAALVREEDTIRDLIRDTFQEIWFSEDEQDLATTVPTPSRVPRPAGIGHEEIPSDNAKMVLNPGSDGVNVVAVQLMEVVYGVKDNTWLVKLLRGMIFGPGSGDKQKKDRSKKREAAVRRCKALVEALVAIQLGLDHGISAIPEGTVSPLNELPTQLLACVDTLAVMCKASPSLVASHVDTLLPYLKGENGLSNAQESTVCRQVSDMVYDTLPLLNRPDAAQMTELSQDLVGLAYRFGSAVVHSSLRCLARLVQLVTHDSTPLLELLQSFYSRLHRHRHDVQQAAGLDHQVRHHMLRGLVVSGCICRFYAFGDSGNAHLPGVDEPMPEDDAWPDRKWPAVGGGRRGETVPTDPPKRVTEKGARVEVFEMLRLYLTTAKEAEIRSKALQGLGQLLIGAPRLMLLADKYGVVGGALKPSAGDAVLAQALRCWQDILAAEEERVETGLAIDDMAATGVTVAQRVQGDQDAESSVVGGVLQMHLDAVLSHLFHRSKGVRSAAISLLGVMLRQGLVNPVDVVPQLLALGGDSAQFVRGEAFRLLTVEDSKNNEFVRTRLLDGLFMAYTFQQHVLGDWRPLLPSNDPASGGRGGCSLVGPAYTMCVRPQRPTRYACLKQLMSLFAEGKAREVRSLVQSAKQRIGVSHLGEDGGFLQGAALGVASSPSYRSGGNGLSRSGSLGCSTDALRLLGPLDLRVLSFVCCTLAGLPYEVQEEPLFIVDYVNRQMSLHGSQCLELLHTLLARNGVSTPPPDSEEVEDSDGEGGNIGVVPSTIALEETSRTEDGLSHLRRTCSVAASFSMLLRLKRYLKMAYGLTPAKCQAYRPNEATKATEKQAQIPNPPPEAFSPFSSRKGGGRTAFDPATLGTAAEAAAETLKRGSPQQLKSFYLELRGLAHDDPEDYSAWGNVAASVRLNDEDSEESRSGGEGKRGRKRGHSEAGLAVQEEGEGSGGGVGGGRDGGGIERQRRASTGAIGGNSETKRSSSEGVSKKVRKGKGKKVNPKRRQTIGSAVLSESGGDAVGDEGDEEEYWV